MTAKSPPFAAQKPNVCQVVSATTDRRVPKTSVTSILNACPGAATTGAAATLKGAYNLAKAIKSAQLSAALTASAQQQMCVTGVRLRATTVMCIKSVRVKIVSARNALCKSLCLTCRQLLALSSSLPLASARLPFIAA